MSHLMYVHVLLHNAIPPFTYLLSMQTEIYAFSSEKSFDFMLLFFILIIRYIVLLSMPDTVVSDKKRSGHPERS